MQVARLGRAMCQLCLNARLKEQGRGTLVLLHLFRVTWGQSAHEAFCGLVSLNAVNHNFIHVATVKVANGAFDHVAFFIHQGRGLACEAFSRISSQVRMR